MICSLYFKCFMNIIFMFELSSTYFGVVFFDSYKRKSLLRYVDLDVLVVDDVLLSITV
jgi:hypothetical protein